MTQRVTPRSLSHAPAAMMRAIDANQATRQPPEPCPVDISLDAMQSSEIPDI